MWWTGYARNFRTGEVLTDSIKGRHKKLSRTQVWMSYTYRQHFKTVWEGKKASPLWRPASDAMRFLSGLSAPDQGGWCRLFKNHMDTGTTGRLWERIQSDLVEGRDGFKEEEQRGGMGGVRMEGQGQEHMQKSQCGGMCLLAMSHYILCWAE